MASAARNASGSTRRRLALSSSVRSSHWLAAVWAVFCCREMRKRPSALIRSARIGLRLYAMALEPICSDSNGSSSSPFVLQQAQIPGELRAPIARDRRACRG